MSKTSSKRAVASAASEFLSFPPFNEGKDDPVNYFSSVMHTMKNQMLQAMNCIHNTVVDLKSLQSTVKHFRQDFDGFHKETVNKITEVEKKLEEHEANTKEYEKIKLECTALEFKLKQFQVAVEEFKSTKSVLNKYEEKFRVHRERIRGIESRARRNNIVIHGVDHMVDMENQKEWFRKFFLAKLDLNPKIVSVIKLGHYRATGVPFLITLKSFQEKTIIFSNSYKLRTEGQLISIQDDLTPEEREERKKLIPILELLRGQGKKVGFRGAVLYVEGLKYEPALEKS